MGLTLQSLIRFPQQFRFCWNGINSSDIGEKNKIKGRTQLVFFKFGATILSTVWTVELAYSLRAVTLAGSALPLLKIAAIAYVFRECIVAAEIGYRLFDSQEVKEMNSFYRLEAAQKSKVQANEADSPNVNKKLSDAVTNKFFEDASEALWTFKLAKSAYAKLATS